MKCECCGGDIGRNDRMYVVYEGINRNDWAMVKMPKEPMAYCTDCFEGIA